MKLKYFHHPIILIMSFITFMATTGLSRTICVDPGHGGSDIGAPGINGSAYPNECDINLVIAHDYLEVELWWYYSMSDVYMTRITDVNPTYAIRCQIVNGQHEDAYGYTAPIGGVEYFVSVHCNSSGVGTNGTSVMIWDSNNWTYTPATTTGRYLLAESIIDEYLTSTISVYGAAHTAYYAAGIVGRNDIYVLTNTWMPANLVECEFVDYQTTWEHLTNWYFNSNWDYVEAAGEGIADGIYDYSPIINSVDQKESMNEISGFHLQENYPNPFNPTTTIKYKIEKETIVELEIFNLTGQLIKTLTKDHKSSGSYSAVWDGTNNHGFSVASGTYICRLHAGDYSKSIKLALLR